MQSRKTRSLRTSATAVLAAAVCSLAGCATGSTPADLLTNEKTIHETLTIDAAPALVYQRVVSEIRPCFARPPWRVEADFFSASNSARISTSLVGSSMVLALFVADLTPNEKGGTTLKLAHRAVEQPLADSIAAWAQGSKADCSLHK